MPVFSSTHSTKALSGGFSRIPTTSSNLAAKSGSGLNVKVRTRCGCNMDSTSMWWTVLGGKSTSWARVRTLQRLWNRGCWQTFCCTFCQVSAPCLGRSARAGAVLESFQAIRSKGSSPLADGDGRHLQARRQSADWSRRRPLPTQSGSG